ncbi:glycosyltransferase [Aureibaculum sp. 2210JD6-5]|uniref:glycosyltransferase n=1 Tax=Aureibaculum sp. 2210JD6-5 TaxID=3103957 RepID=UPI002AAD174D|nr:glycosyltransferase [Aureibaculum sp. 2210JD6-5]MDY7396187.1 glycosyltransferase [Aureibaculum sp. 2210JD6-5]
MKIAIVHYWFITRRGGEKVVESLLKIFPEADIYTLFYDKETYGDYLNNHTVFTSVLNTSFLRKHYQKIFPLYPLGIKSLKLIKKYDLIISSESGPAKGIKIKDNMPHICYVHTPMRYCWSHKNEYLNSVNQVLRPLMSFFLNRLKNWDKSTVDNVNLYISNSENVANRVKKYYQRKSEVVYPPISDDLFLKPLNQNEKKDIFLSFGAITPYKRIDLLVEVFNKNGKKLVIIGEGTEREKLEKKAKKNIVFKESLPWNEIEYYLSKTKALLFPGEEDFGMIPLEVMAYGIPVIAYKKGGALETIIEDRDNTEQSSGLFFVSQNCESIQESIDLFEKKAHKFNPIWIRNHAKNFSEAKFIKNMKYQIKKLEV